MSLYPPCSNGRQYGGNVLELTFSGTIVPVFNEQIIKEYREVLSRPKFHFTEEIVSTVVDEIERLGLFVDAEELDIEMPDPKDRVFYEVVMEERKSDDAYLVAGNLKHFPEKPFVVTPRQMLEIIAQSTDK